MDFEGLRCLVVDDEYVNFAFLKELLKRKSMEVMHAENGFEALKKLENNTFDFVLMDLKMPIMNGYEANAEIEVKYPDLPVFAQTAYGFTEVKEKVMNSGFEGYLKKPIKRDELFELIDTVVVKKKID